jgi:hypothetical protein
VVAFLPSVVPSLIILTQLNGILPVVEHFSDIPDYLFWRKIVLPSYFKNSFLPPYCSTEKKTFKKSGMGLIP